MSITRDLRSYADELTGKATVTVAELRTQAEKAVNLQAIKAAVEPYLEQAKDYTHSVTDRAGGLVGTVTSDKRVARLVTTAEALTGAVAETVQVKIVKPVRSLTGLGNKPAARPAPRPAAQSAAKPAASAAASRPAAKATTRKPATKPAAKATGAKPAARKAPAKKAAGH
ncbi:hypothetical protein M6B22_13275 [Jatrophihabitans cynanchi]|jgi:hypothetical protein|uniref:BON domain-containing protein n=1 Tax=Jatrophihabitans cynanchi TaxID=2944128 RepID=A0ABY7JSH6_9ACTN|nr:hypothetical protein [Jatrophihabitans sp. SB3-54]WAX55512.1 hypothetical protein M6B22_13275 [Jatrophihabitans sp. SB3-54]